MANMEKSVDNLIWKEYCLENTARFICERFRNSCVWVIRASKHYLNTFACYENFLAPSVDGINDYVYNSLKATPHVTLLLKNLITLCKF